MRIVLITAIARWFGIAILHQWGQASGQSCLRPH
jgi:hypothetical protein